MTRDALEDVNAAVEQAWEEAAGDREAPIQMVWVGSKPGKRLRSIIGFAAFFLAVSLILGSLGQIAGRLAWERDTRDWMKSDWQQTEQFRWRVADYLAAFLTLGAGGALDWYETEYYLEYGCGYDWSWGATANQVVVSSDIGSLDAPESKDVLAPDLPYQIDKNVLYRVVKDGKPLYGNADGADLSGYEKLPEGYNFLLTYAGGKVTITKDGAELDIYGDGVYDADSEWYVPGYENFQAGDGVDGVSIQLAVRARPIQYLTGSYQSGTVRQSNRMYWIYQSMQDSQSFYKTRTVACGVGIAFLALYLVLRRSKVEADRLIAKGTAHVWTEARAIAVLVCVVWLVIGGGALADWAGELYWMIREAEAGTYMVETAGRYGVSLLEHTAALLSTFWVLYLIVNDHRYTPKEQRKSLLGIIAVRERKYPFQKRINRWNRLAAVLVCLPVVTAVWFGLVSGLWEDLLDYGSGGAMAYFLLVVVLGILAAAAVWLALRRSGLAARDMGRIMDQVEAVRAGDLTHPLDLPEDSDLKETAEHINDLQAGMKNALAEQTHSERMKVALISNVSHDLKTPLTSIISYADLLREEECLPDHVNDYIRIIEEKAKRLSTMVQDVFEVSKAAADQLPVKLERLDLGKLLRQTLADMAEPIEHSGLTFKTDLPDKPVFIVADGTRLYRVFQNLVQNALKYAMDGSRVYLTLTAGQGRAEASLRNTSRDELPAGVDFTARFVRGDESRTDGGSGLGLSIASSFTEACGGAFRVETVADLYTAIVTFPLAQET